ncbi:MAG TPA: FUSC family protein [Candidatus Binataceae bacterium]|nr:FUSC family protein [Candidatus Binataceae bacterium]
MAGWAASRLALERRIARLPAAQARWVAHGFEAVARQFAAELAPRPRRTRTAIRIAAIGAIAAGVMTACHVESTLGLYAVTVIAASPGAAMRPVRAVRYAVIDAILLTLAVVLGGIIVETPWLMLPAVGGVAATFTYITTSRRMGSVELVLEVTVLDTLYGAVFKPDGFASGAASTYGGFVLALGILVLFDSWLWPDPAEPRLLESISESLAQSRERLVAAADYYQREGAGVRPEIPPVISRMPVQLALLERVVSEGATPYHRALLLGAINRAARIRVHVDMIITAAREPVARRARAFIATELAAHAAAIAEALDEAARETLSGIRGGAAAEPGSAAARVRPALAALEARIAVARPAYLPLATAVEMANLGAFHLALTQISGLIDHPIDAPPISAAAHEPPARRAESATDPALIRHSLKVGLAIMIGYTLGLTTRRDDLSVIMTTIVIAGLPTYGATLSKMLLRFGGSAMAAVITVLTVIIITPNFDSVSVYMATFFVVLFVSAWGSFSNDAFSYAFKQIASGFVLSVAGLAPHPAIEAPLWRIWGVLLGAAVLVVVFCLLWPEYAGDAMLPRLRKVLGAALDLAPGGASAVSAAAVRATSAEIDHVLAETLSVVDDARIEGRRSRVDANAALNANGTLRRIAHHLASIAINRLEAAVPELAPPIESARAELVRMTRGRLASWLEFFLGPNCQRSRAALALAASHPATEMTGPLRDFEDRIAVNSYAATAEWTLEQRRVLLAEIHSFTRLATLLTDLSDELARVPRPRPIY